MWDGSAPVAVVTGAASGIGAACVAELAARGFATAGLDLAPTEHAGVSLEVDVQNGDDVARALKRVKDELGSPWGLVHAAGHHNQMPADEITAESWSRMLSVHLGGLLHTCRVVIPIMVAQGSGSIVAVASELALGGADGAAHYAAAKGAMIGLVRSLAVEVAGAGVRVNVVAPGPTDTPLLPPDSPEREPTYLAKLPARRLVTAEEVALTVGFLFEEGGYFCGEVISPNSGAVI